MMRAIFAAGEMAEAITDQWPGAGRLDPNGAQIGDMCAWLSSGQGAAMERDKRHGS
jgi:hypothetical protein